MQGCQNKGINCPLFSKKCASSLFNAGVDRKPILDRTGHRSYALMTYEKANEKVQTNVSVILGPNFESSTVSATISVDSSSKSVSRQLEKVSQIWILCQSVSKCTVNFHFK